MVTKPVVTVPAGLPPKGVRGDVEIAHVELDDPFPNLSLSPGTVQKQLTAKNVKCDVLEREYSRQRLSKAAYAAGFKLQRALENCEERASGGGQWMVGDRVDVARASDQKAVRSIDKARQLVQLKTEIQTVVGRRNADMLYRVLLGQETFAEISQDRKGRSNDADILHIGETFRECLEDLANHWAARGADSKEHAVEVSTDGRHTVLRRSHTFGA